MRNVQVILPVVIIFSLGLFQFIECKKGMMKCELNPSDDAPTQDQLVAKLTNTSCYDKLIKPDPSPLHVTVQVELNHVEVISQAQFKVHMLVQYKYRDPRLEYASFSKRRVIMGEQPLRDEIWVPHLIVRNEQSATIMGFDTKDVLIRIDPNGDVHYSVRITAIFYCWMNLKKFPFDSQKCHLRWGSWSYNASDLILTWDEEAVVATDLHLTEFFITNFTANQTVDEIVYGNYSELILEFYLTREVGYYIMVYFLPSILLVITSWVTFWLQADAGPPRATLGTSTTLAFITLNGGLSSNLPKVSYVKASDIWFLACSVFIFGSLAEFAFVNVIWRRRKTVELKKPNSKHIIKGAFTPSLARKDLRKAESLYIVGQRNSFRNTMDSQNSLNLSRESMDNDSVFSEGSTTAIDMPSPIDKIQKPTWHSMTPQEVAIWVDRKSRIIFPVAFLIFNIFYWTFVYIL